MERPGPHEPGGTFGTMRVTDTDQGAGRLYRCKCGWEGWSSWGHARKHAASCEKAHQEWDDA